MNLLWHIDNATQGATVSDTRTKEPGVFHVGDRVQFADGYRRCKQGEVIEVSPRDRSVLTVHFDPVKGHPRGSTYLCRACDLTHI